MQGGNLSLSLANLEEKSNVQKCHVSSTENPSDLFDLDEISTVDILTHQ